KTVWQHQPHYPADRLAAVRPGVRPEPAVDRRRAGEAGWVEEEIVPFSATTWGLSATVICKHPLASTNDVDCRPFAAERVLFVASACRRVPWRGVSVWWPGFHSPCWAAAPASATKASPTLRMRAYPGN